MENKVMFDDLMARAKKLGEKVDTDWAYEHEAQYNAYEDEIVTLYNDGKLTIDQLIALANEAFYDYDLEGWGIDVYMVKVFAWIDTNGKINQLVALNKHAADLYEDFLNAIKVEWTVLDLDQVDGIAKGGYNISGGGSDA